MMIKTVAVAAFALALACTTGAGAQTRGPREGEVASEPIKCWWKADRPAVRVGERFMLVLTCGVIETATVKVVPNVNQLEPGAISLTPFEAVSGVRREDVVVSPWRYLQFEYEMRLLSEGFFGQDVNIPALTVTYNLQAPGSGDGASASSAADSRVEGRDQTYMLPPLPMRVLSVVPRAAADIRDESGQTFAGVESRRFRATLATVAAAIAFAFSAAFAGFAVVRAAGTVRGRGKRTVAPLPTPAVLRGCLKALSQVRADAAREGWTPELKGRALAALRIAGAVAVGRGVAQQQVNGDVRERSGQLAVRTGVLRRRRAILSAAATPATLAGSLQNGNVQGAQAKLGIQQLADALTAFSTATYSRAPEPDAMTLTNTLDTAVAAIRRLRLTTLWPVRTAQAVARSFTGF